MRHVNEIGNGPFYVILHDGVRLVIQRFTGGGSYIGDHPVTGEPGDEVYEVHCVHQDGADLTIPQRQIARVETMFGEEVEFGNRFFPGHPRQEELPDPPPHVDETVVTLEHPEDSPFPLIYLANAKAPEGYQRVVAGRVTEGHFQAIPFMDFALSPLVLRKIADLIEER